MILVILFTTTILSVLYYYKCAVCSLQYRKENKVFYRLFYRLSYTACLSDNSSCGRHAQFTEFSRSLSLTATVALLNPLPFSVFKKIHYLSRISIFGPNFFSMVRLIFSHPIFLFHFSYLAFSSSAVCLIVSAACPFQYFLDFLIGLSTLSSSIFLSQGLLLSVL